MKFISSVFPMIFLAAAAQAQQTAPVDSEMEEILSLDIADLTVTSASKREQKLSDVPAAIYVISHEDLHRAGITSIPEALRMVPGMEVAQTASNAWAVSARGFNSAFANKLLVLIDGRTIYTPIFSGTYWDDQSVPIEDIDRIEVIRGPGASLYGANAVDGIINIITKSAADTQGNMVSAGGGTREGFIEGRHGGQSGDAFYRAYGQFSDYGQMRRPGGDSDHDRWDRARSGFRVDGKGAEKDSYTLEGDAYDGRQSAQQTFATATPPFSATTIRDNSSYGGDILGRWNHEISKDSVISLQAYVDHYSRLEAIDGQHVTTGDIEFQHNLRLDERNNFIWGAGARVHTDDLTGSFAANFNTSQQTHETFNAFAQDEYALIPSTLYATLGSKFEYNDFTGFEVEPSARLTWHPVSNQTVWAAVSRAVRTPSDVDEDVNLVAAVLPGAPPTVLRVVGNPNQKSEDLIAYELGHRIQPTRSLSFDTSVFYNRFTNLETIGQPGAPVLSNGMLVVSYMFDNLGSGDVYGLEESANWNISHRWRLTGGYSYLRMNLDVAPAAAADLRSTERLAPRHQFSIRSYWNVTDSVQWDNMLYYVSAISAPADAYFRYDTRLGWQITPGIEASLIGRNLLQHSHPEFPVIPQTEVPRSALAEITWKF
ncbi:MAG: TonB-dependent receptor [Alphaproteobacteria bacterium]|nr:TonB-dependent receptor [Alphaproteobacteria bacterium]